MQLPEIFEQLLLGKKLKLVFPSRDEVKLFKIRLHQVKKHQEDQMISIGGMTEGDKLSLLFSTEPDLLGSIEVTIQLAKKPEKKDYAVTIVE